MPLPPPPVVGDYLKLTARAWTIGQIGQVSCHYKVTAVAGGGVSVQGIADSFAVITDTQWPFILCPEAVSDAPFVELLSLGTGKVQQSAIGVHTPAIGVVGTDQCPTQVAAVVKKVTGFAGQAYRGRLYFPFVPRDHVTADGELSAAGVTAYQGTAVAMFQAFVATQGLSSTSLTPYLLHTPGPAFPLPLVGVEIFNFLVTGRLGTQKRRGDYGRLNPL